MCLPTVFVPFSLLVQELGGTSTPRAVCEAIVRRGISSAPIKPTDVMQIMETLVADGRIDSAGAAARRAAIYNRTAVATYRARAAAAGGSGRIGGAGAEEEGDADMGFGDAGIDLDDEGDDAYEMGMDGEQ